MFSSKYNTKNDSSLSSILREIFKDLVARELRERKLEKNSGGDKNQRDNKESGEWHNNHSRRHLLLLT